MVIFIFIIYIEYGTLGSFKRTETNEEKKNTFQNALMKYAISNEKFTKTKLFKDEIEDSNKNFPTKNNGLKNKLKRNESTRNTRRTKTVINRSASISRSIGGSPPKMGENIPTALDKGHSFKRLLDISISNNSSRKVIFLFNKAHREVS